MASDSAASFGTPTALTIGQQEVPKVQCISDTVLYSSTGAIGIAQMITDKLRQLTATNDFQKTASPDEAMDKIGKAIGNLVYPYLQSAPFVRQATGEISASFCKSLVSVAVGGIPHLFQFDYNGSPERATMKLPFVALGSGEPIADPFLALLKRLLWSKSEPTMAEGKLAAVWTISHVTLTNPGGVGGPIQLATLPRGGKASLLSESDISEHLQRVESAEGVLASELRGDAKAATPPPAPPPEP